jgi:hypothetical protein
MTVITLEIVNAVRINDTAGERRKVVIESFDDLLDVGVAFAEKIADELLLLGVDTGNRIARRFVEGSISRDDLKLTICFG